MRIIMKFGGTSLGDIEAIKRAARIIKEKFIEGNEIVVVVSAMSGTTNQLLGYISQFTFNIPAENEVILSSGEQITVGLLAIALGEIGLKTRSYLGWQIAIQTDATWTHARIQSIQSGTLLHAMQQKIIPVCAGFQGIHEGRITTLGLGGSDTTAVALAVTLEADWCYIYTDVTGVYSADPNVVKNAQKLDRLTHKQMLALSGLGAKVMNPQAMELAEKNKINICILSSFVQTEGTLVISSDKLTINKGVKAIVYDRHQYKIQVTLHKKNWVSHIDQWIQSVDMFQFEEHDTTVQLQFVSTTNAHIPFKALLDSLKQDGVVQDYAIESNYSKISLVGFEVKQKDMYTLFSTALKRSFPVIDLMGMGDRLSFLVPEDYTELAVRSLHEAYELDSSDSL